MARSPVGLIGSTDRTLRPTFAKARVWLSSTPECCPCFDHFFPTAQLVYLTARIISTFIHFTLLWLLQMVFPWSCAYDPPSSLVKFAINSRPWRLEEPILKWKGERGWVLHLTNVQIAAILSECLNIFAAGRSWLLLLLMQSVKLVV